MHMIDGEKHLVLVDPIESALLYADFADAAFGNSPVDAAAVDLDTGTINSSTSSIILYSACGAP